MCRLEIRGDKDDIGYSIDLMLENGTTDITVAHIDSMPPSFTFLAEEVAANAMSPSKAEEHNRSLPNTAR